MRNFSVLFLIVFIVSCSARKSPSEPSETVEQLLTSAWQDYAEFRFSDARSKFSNIVNSDATNLEAYYGLSLSSLSLGIYNESYSNAIVGTSVGEGVLLPIRDTIILDNNNYSNYYDTLKVNDTTYVWRLKLPNRNIVNIVSINKGIDIIQYSTYYDSIIVGVSDTGSLLKPGDTIIFFIQFTSNQSLDIYKWLLFAVAGAAYYYDGKGKQAFNNLLVPIYRSPSGNLPARVVKSFKLLDVQKLMLNVLNVQEDYILMAHILHQIDNSWPNSSVGWTCQSWTFSPCDIKWAILNVNYVKDKYYEILSQP